MSEERNYFGELLFEGFKFFLKSALAIALLNAPLVLLTIAIMKVWAGMMFQSVNYILFAAAIISYFEEVCKWHATECDDFEKWLKAIEEEMDKDDDDEYYEQK